MLNKNLELAARAMGYRKLDPRVEIWAKPFGYGMIVINRAPWRIEQLFRGYQNEEIAVYTSTDLRYYTGNETFTPNTSMDSVLVNIKWFEAEAVKLHLPNTKMDMHFLEEGEDLIILSGVIE